MRHGTFRAESRAIVRHRGLLLSLVCAALLPLGGLGCASDQSDLTVTSLASRERYEPQFTAAYAGRSPQGLDVVLASDHNLGAPAGAAMTAAASGPSSLKQVMHIRVLWAPDRPIKVTSPASTNACIHWYVFTDDPRRPEMIQYSGTAMATIDAHGDVTRVKLRNATITPAMTQGRLNDPIGAASFEGELVARNDRRRVDDLLSEVKTTVAAAKIDRQHAAGHAAAPVGP